MLLKQAINYQSLPIIEQYNFAYVFSSLSSIFLVLNDLILVTPTLLNVHLRLF